MGFITTPLMPASPNSAGSSPPVGTITLGCGSGAEGSSSPPRAPLPRSPVGGMPRPVFFAIAYSFSALVSRPYVSKNNRPGLSVLSGNRQFTVYRGPTGRWSGPPTSITPPDNGLARPNRGPRSSSGTKASVASARCGRRPRRLEDSRHDEALVLPHAFHPPEHALPSPHRPPPPASRSRTWRAASSSRPLPSATRRTAAEAASARPSSIRTTPPPRRAAPTSSPSRAWSTSRRSSSSPRCRPSPSR